MPTSSPVNSPDCGPLSKIGVGFSFASVEPRHLAPATTEVLRRARNSLAEIAASSPSSPYSATFGRFDRALSEVRTFERVIDHIEHVATRPEYRAAYNSVKGEFASFWSDVWTDSGVFAALQSSAGSPAAQSMSAPHQRFMHKTLDSFRREGTDLSAEKKSELKQLNIRLAEMTALFSQQVLDATNAYEEIFLDRTSLAGLPERELHSARNDAKERGKEGYRFTLKGPSFLAIMTYLDDRAIRERFYQAYASRCSGGEYDNRARAAEILALRHRRANLLGYATFADLVTEDRMAKRPETVREFLTQLEVRTRPFMERESAELASFARDHLGIDELKPWDVAYAAEKLRQQQYSFDEEAIRPYLPLPRVLQGLFSLGERLFGVSVREASHLPVWDPKVKAFSAHDEDGTLLGYFYVDLHPRDNKRGGAWMDGWIAATPHAGGWTPHVAFMGANFTEGSDTTPPLLSHDEMTTLFHEYGHLLHHLCSRVEIEQLAGTEVEWDFVELPSQIMENWCWESEALQGITSHVSTGDPMPPELIAKLRRSRIFRSATQMMRQLSFGLLDLGLHTDPTLHSIDPFMRYSWEISNRFSPVPLPTYHASVLSFTHLFAEPVGYASGYYSYKWAEVLDADAFARFQEEGILNGETGRAFRSIILARGNSEDPAELFRKFRGRDPSLDPLLRRDGLR